MRRLGSRRLAALCVAASVAALAACTDSARTSEPVYATSGSGGGGIGGAAGQTAPAADAGAAGSGGAAGGGQAGGSPSGGAAGGPAQGGQSGQGGAVGGAMGGLAPPAPQGLASLNSDGTTSSLSLLNSVGGVSNGSCVQSNSVGSGTSKTISGDAVLPSQPQRGGTIVIVDRGNGELTFVDPIGCFIARQISVPGGPNIDPHDVVMISDRKAYVTRYQANPASVTVQQLGNDVAVINPTTGAFLSRINLDAFASKGSGAGVLSRPDRALIADGKVIVSLNQVDDSRTNFGDGAVVVIDTATDMPVYRVSLPGLFDCAGMDFVPASHTLLVSCGGIPEAQNQPLQSGVAVIDLSTSPPRLDHVVSSVAFGGRPLNFEWVLAAPRAGSPSGAFAGTNDPDGDLADGLFQFDFTTGAVVPVTTAGPMTLGIPALAAGLLFVPEATAATPKIQLFDVTGAPQAISGFTPDVTTGLPPRQIAWY